MGKHAPTASESSPRPPHIVIIGGGFGGLFAAQELGKANVRVTLVDRQNHHLFQPLLYQAAIAALSARDIALPIRAAVREQRNTTVLLAEVTGIDLERKRVQLADGVLDYDYLIVAAGARTDYFGHDEWARCALGLKSIADAQAIRRRVLLAYEIAERLPATDARRASWLTFAIVGGGPTGVELAGALAELGQHAMVRDFRHFDPSHIRVVLLEGGPRLLPAMAEELGERARKELQRRSVEVRLNAMVDHVDHHGLQVGSERIDARTVLWAAGVRPTELVDALPLEKTRRRVRVTPELSLPDHPEVFVVGDAMHFEQDGKPLPGLAPVATQSGKHAARNALARAQGRHARPFVYRDRGTMATIGRSSAVAQVGRLRFGGLIGWLLWGLVHIVALYNPRRRAQVVIEWAWYYLTWQRGARIVWGPSARMVRAALTEGAGEPAAVSESKPLAPSVLSSSQSPEQRDPTDTSASTSPPC